MDPVQVVVHGLGVSVMYIPAFTCFHHYPEINMLGEISKHFKFTETHAGFYLGFFVSGCRS